MNTDEFKAVLQAADFMISNGEYELAQDMIVKAMQHLRIPSGEDAEEKANERLEIETELTRKYLKTKQLEGKTSSLNENLFMTTAVKTLIVCFIISLFLFLGVTAVRKKITRGVNKIEQSLSMSDMRKIKIEAMISRNPYLYYKAALIYEKQDDIENAIEQTEKALGLAPDNKAYIKKLKDLQARQASNMKK
ncbi:MAG: tetratricopeptide repeat protein [Nitrospirae bacterium]|nr:tetratricopeptide repeat protein [Nitrospirota bacterium]